LQDPSTAHVTRVELAFSRTGDFLELARSLAPADFDSRHDAVCIHRKGTVLYASPTLARILGLAGGEALVGGRVADFVHPNDRTRVSAAIRRPAHGLPARATTATFTASGGRSILLGLHVVPTSEAIPPVEILYLRPVRFADAADGEDERYMATRESSVLGHETRRASVLICDDEARLGTLTAGLLTEYGFSPITVGTGEDAIIALSNADPAIDVVLLDVNLSHGKPARDVLATMEARGDRARVVLTSGLAEEDVDPGLIGHPSVVGYVPKPYGVDELVQSIRKALGLQHS